MQSVFLDANCYLSFYKLASVDLEELRKLVALVTAGEIRLYATRQIRDEVARNRESVIAASLDDASKRNPTGGFPQLLRNYDGFGEVESARRAFSQLLTDLLAEVEADAIANKLHADTLISELFEHATPLGDGEDIVKRARERVSRGNPPGKNGSHGDAINWEALLGGHPAGEDLVLVTEDKDFRSALVDDDVAEVLAAEWAQAKRSRLALYRDLAKYFADNFPNIKVAEDAVRDRAVDALRTSPSFAATHSAIAALERIGTFTLPQVNALLEAALRNSQVHALLRDDDVSSFFRRLLALYGDKADAESAATVHALVNDLSRGSYPGVGPDGNDYWDGEAWHPF